MSCRTSSKCGTCWNRRLPGWQRSARPPEDVGRLTAILEEQHRQILEGETGVDADTEFHFALAAATHNNPLLKVVNAVEDVLRRSRDRYLQQPGRPERSMRVPPSNPGNGAKPRRRRRPPRHGPPPHGGRTRRCVGRIARDQLGVNFGTNYRWRRGHRDFPAISMITSQRLLCSLRQNNQ